MPFQGEFTHILVPRAMPWAKCLLAFQAVFRRIPETSIIHIIAVWGKAPKVRKNTDGGDSPRNKRINKTKP